jgi:hypothetical protein
VGCEDAPLQQLVQLFLLLTCLTLISKVLLNDEPLYYHYNPLG